ncbi:MAG TPA: sigma-70 family RNA polymerase sigma factor [Steroidobacteraceae bacterium]|nr:sigma-70 family RNA polymerase sigma factor [Steroidobacteraceae bacterium]
MQARFSQIRKRPDEDLLRDVASGDRRALDALYLGYHRRLARFLTRIAPQYETAEEIINDTFLVVWQRAKEFRGASRVSTWIIGIAYRIALKSLRRNDGLVRAQRYDSLPEPWVEPGKDTELSDWVAQGLSRLPIEQRLALELAYGMGHSIEEIAEITGSPVGTVKARMFHAREKLRQYLPVLGGLDAPHGPEI